MSIELKALTPLLQVYDMTAATHFYCDLLGFEIVACSPIVETREGRFSHWMRLRRGCADLMLNSAYDSNERPPARDEQRWKGHSDTGLFIDCSDVDAMYASLGERGMRLEPPIMTAYGMKCLRIRDPDGYEINFQMWPPSAT